MGVLNTHEESEQEIEPLRASISRLSAASLHMSESPELETLLHEVLESRRQDVHQIRPLGVTPLPSYGTQLQGGSPRWLTSPHFSPGGMIMAQEFSLQRVLATEERSGHYARGSMCALKGKRQARACPALSVTRKPLPWSQSKY